MWTGRGLANEAYSEKRSGIWGREYMAVKMSEEQSGEPIKSANRGKFLEQLASDVFCYYKRSK